MRAVTTRAGYDLTIEKVTDKNTVRRQSCSEDYIRHIPGW
jgi:hypothetical protein